MDCSGKTVVLNTLPSNLQKQLVDCKQEHLLHFWAELSPEEQENLTNQLESIDFSLCSRLFEKDYCVEEKTIQPCDVILLNDTFREAGSSSIANGEIGVLTVAGGQGTRLGWSGPKGTFPATPITGKSLFQLIAEQILFASEKYKTTIPWYIMTSKENDDATRSFLLDNNCFGMQRTDIFLFTQNEIPAVNDDGNMMLSTKSSITMNPDGHGGVVSALHSSGGLDEMVTRGIKYLSYVQVDNPLANVIDPDFIGLHTSDSSSSEVSSKCVLKSNPDERVGVFCNVNGRVQVVEYSDLPSQKAHECTTEGMLVYASGSIAMHLFTVSFLQKVADDLPWHKAHKKVAFIDLQSGKRIEPEEPNACKFEKFVFDVIPFATHSLVVETSRKEEFAPIKNASGKDSAETSHALQLERAKRWLHRCGVKVSNGALVEISPLSGASAEDLMDNQLPSSIGDKEVMVI
jgi:UDP-N-acetylglucosamine/UDP-N-acetylgalactosamine diphosphorylase